MMVEIEQFNRDDVVRFVQRYLVRADNRQEISPTINHAKSEFLRSKG
jgi:hypothetical protein